jgi:hypothetical protein
MSAWVIGTVITIAWAVAVACRIEVWRQNRRCRKYLQDREKSDDES